MARKLRIQYPGAIYHVMNRGDRQEPVSGDDRDRRRFLETLTEACQKTGWQAHAFCLMSNHFHLVVQPPQPNLVAGMKWFLGAYTSRYNRRRKEFRRELLEQVSARPGPRHFGEAVQAARLPATATPDGIPCAADCSDWCRRPGTTSFRPPGWAGGVAPP
ncbi:MAG: transposase, partial [Limisphaerales bacterium]